MKQKSFQHTDLNELDKQYNKFAKENDIQYRTVNTVAVPNMEGTIDFVHFMFIQYGEPKEVWEWSGGAFLDGDEYSVMLDDRTKFKIPKSNCVEKTGTYGPYWQFSYDGNDYQIRVKKNGSLGVKIKK